MKRAVAVAFVASVAVIGPACLGNLEKQLKADMARSRHMAQVCQDLLYDPPGSLGGKKADDAFDVDSDLLARVPAVVSSIGTLSGPFTLVAGERGNLTVSSSLDVNLGNLLAIKTYIDNRLVPSLAQGSDVAKQAAGRMQAALAQMLGTIGYIEPGKGAPDGIYEDLRAIEEQGADIRRCLASVKNLNPHTLDSKTVLASMVAFADAAHNCRASIGTLQSSVGKFTSHMLEVESRFAELRAAVDVAEPMAGDLGTVSTALRSSVSGVVGTLRAQTQWSNDAAAVIEMLRQLANADPLAGTAQVRHLLTGLGQRYLARVSGGAARIFYRSVATLMRRANGELDRLAGLSPAVGLAVTAFANEALERMTNRAGEVVGGMLARVGDGSKAFVYEACLALQEGDESGAVVGMPTFYRGLVAGYSPPPPPKRKEKSSAPTQPAKPKKATVPERAGLAVLKAQFAGFDASMPDSERPPTIGALDMLADWASLKKCELDHVWAAAQPRCERSTLRLESVYTLLVAPELVLLPAEHQVAVPVVEPPQPGIPPDAGVPVDSGVVGVDSGAGATSGPAPPVGAQPPPVVATSQVPVPKPSEPKIDEILVSVALSGDLSAIPKGGDTIITSFGSLQAGENVDKLLVAMDAEFVALSGLHEKFLRSHQSLLDSNQQVIETLERRESHWLGNQFVASLCGALTAPPGERARFVCNDRNKEDAIATINIAPPTDGLPSGEWTADWWGPGAKKGASGEDSRTCALDPKNPDDPCLAKIRAGTSCSRTAPPKAVAALELPACGDLRHVSLRLIPDQQVLDDDLTLLAADIRSLASQLLKQASASRRSSAIPKPFILVTGSASRSGFTCAQIEVRLRTSSDIPPCAAGAMVPGQSLCYARVGDSLVLDVGDPSKSLSCSVSNTSETATPNRMLAILRGMTARRKMLKELKGWDADVTFDIDPPPGMGSCGKAGSRDCTRFQSVQVHVFAK